MSLNLARQATLSAVRGTRQMSTQSKILAERAVSAGKHNGGSTAAHNLTPPCSSVPRRSPPQSACF